MRRNRRRSFGRRGSTNLGGQDAGGGACGACSTRRRRPCRLRIAAQGALQPKVPRPLGRARARLGRLADGRHAEAARRAGAGDDDGGAAQHAARAGRDGLRGAGGGAGRSRHPRRVSLHERQVAWHGLGGVLRARAAVRKAGCALGDDGQRAAGHSLARGDPRPHVARRDVASAGAAALPLRRRPRRGGPLHLSRRRAGRRRCGAAKGVEAQPKPAA
mmetsp:Transcript_14645/g.47353  ORF Transcript_14645/g.47353 Transcript_14645/m.47353 type:complete len:217 (+) Transcript_14645:134-784(+)